MGRPASALIGLLLAGCGAGTTGGGVPATPSAPPTVSPPAPPTVSPPAPPVSAAMIVAVADRVFLRTPASGAAYGECDSGTDFSACPVTARLLGRLLQFPLSGGAGGAAPFCRCQNFSPTLSVTATPGTGGGIAHVTIFGSIVIDLVITLVHGTLLVDDTRCGGRDASTSIFANPVMPCAPLSAHYP